MTFSDSKTRIKQYDIGFYNPRNKFKIQAQGPGDLDTLREGPGSVMAPGYGA